MKRERALQGRAGVRQRLGSAAGRRQLAQSLFFRTWRALFPVAAAYRRFAVANTRVVAVVGSFGKTTTARAVYAALGLSRRPPLGWNSGAFLAAEVLRLRRADRHGVLEVGISRRGTMARCARLIRPDVVVVTSIGSEHHLSLGSLETTRAEKAEMIRALPPTGLAVLNGDDPNVLWMRGQTPARAVTFGFSASCDVRASSVSLDVRRGTRFLLHARGTARAMTSRLLGRHQVPALLAGIAVALEEGVPLPEALARLSALDATPERLALMAAENGACLLVDSYKSVWETILAGLDTLDELGGERRIVILGEIENPQRPQGQMYRELGARLARSAARVVFVGSSRAFESLAGGARSAGMPREQLESAGRSPQRAAELARRDMRPGDIVLIKGRNCQHLERAAYRLAGRPVSCDIGMCRLKTGCATCPLAPLAGGPA